VELNFQSKKKNIKNAPSVYLLIKNIPDEVSLELKFNCDFMAWISGRRNYFHSQITKKNKSNL
jgi:hypothetical protein